MTNRYTTLYNHTMEKETTASSLYASQYEHAQIALQFKSGQIMSIEFNLTNGTDREDFLNIIEGYDYKLGGRNLSVDILLTNRESKSELRQTRFNTFDIERLDVKYSIPVQLNTSGEEHNDESNSELPEGFEPDTGGYGVHSGDHKAGSIKGRTGSLSNSAAKSP